MNLDSVEPNFVDLLNEQPRGSFMLPVRSLLSETEATPLLPPSNLSEFEAKSLAFAKSKLRKSCLSPETFEIQVGSNAQKYEGAPYFAVKFPGTDYAVDRIERRDWETDKDKFPKYRFPSGKKVELFTRRGSLKDYEAAPYTGLAEGQIKAAALDLHLGIPFVGIAGVSGWGEKVKALNEQVAHTTVRPDILKGLAKGRKHIVCFDGDWATNTQVAEELGTYCQEASRFGSEVIVPDFGFKSDGERLGGDDWLFERFKGNPPAPHEVLKVLLALPRVDWQTLPVKASFYTASIDKFNQGHIDFTDRGNATFLLRIYGDGNLRYLSDTREWACYGLDQKWRLYPDGALELVNPAALQRLNYARHLFDLADKTDGDKKDQLLETAKQMHKSYLDLSSNPKRQAVLADLRTREDVISRRDHFDANPYILNTPSGIVDLKTGSLRAATREDLVLNSTKVPYPTEEPNDEDAQRIKAYLVGVTSSAHGVPDPALLEYFLRRQGASLRGGCTLAAMETLFGVGGTGKSVWGKLDTAMLGDYAATIPAGVVLSTYGNQNAEAATPFAMMMLGRRKVYIHETKDTATLDETKLKLLSGGDKLALRGNYKDGQMYSQTATITLITNNLPHITNLDAATRDRMAVIPFRCRFNRGSKVVVDAEDASLPLADTWFQEDAEHSTSALQWLLWAQVQAGVRYTQALAAQLPGCGVPPSCVAEATTTYLEAQDDMAEFIAEGPFMFGMRPSGKPLNILSSEVFRAYEKFCDERGMKAPKNSVFGKRLRDRFPQLQSSKSFGGQKCITGLILKPDLRSGPETESEPPETAGSTRG